MEKKLKGKIFLNFEGTFWKMEKKKDKMFGNFWKRKKDKSQMEKEYKYFSNFAFLNKNTNKRKCFYFHPIFESFLSFFFHIGKPLCNLARKSIEQERQNLLFAFLFLFLCNKQAHKVLQKKQTDKIESQR